MDSAEVSVLGVSANSKHRMGVKDSVGTLKVKC